MSDTDDFDDWKEMDHPNPPSDNGNVVYIVLAVIGIGLFLWAIVWAMGVR